MLLNFFIILCFCTNTAERITNIGTTHDTSDALNQPSTTVRENFSTVSDGVARLREHQVEKVHNKIRDLIQKVLHQV